MNVNAGHERTSKARIIHQIQLIRGITKTRTPPDIYTGAKPADCATMPALKVGALP
ncbi:hypothetical protein [Shigella dysenteriae]|uniref:hypothetical protein n=1 Tax=Shigella dysenteriae TaxID=622 RepID=UPI001493C9AB|nr:hypothetical protein [Shigella dysenteriae]